METKKSSVLIRTRCSRWSRIMLFLLSIAWSLLIIISTDQITRPPDSNHDVVETGNHSDQDGLADDTNINNNNKTIDWTQVEERFNQYLSDEETIQKWETMEANMRSGIKSLLRTVFPKIVALASDAKVSNNCSAGILKWIVNIRHMKSWALKMLDAMGKPPSGIFEGVVTMFGNYDECLKIRVFHEDDDDDQEDGGGSSNQADQSTNNNEEAAGPVEFFRGQYCITEFKPWLPKKPNFYGVNSQYKFFPNDDTVFSDFVKMSLFFHFITFRVDICVPSTCSKEDMQKVANLMAGLAEFRAKVLRCETQTNESESLSDWWIFWIICSIVMLTLAITLVSTLVDLNVPGEKLQRIKIFNLCSIRNSWKHLTRIGSNELNPLNGFQAIILIWIIIVHTFIIVDFQYFREMQTLKSMATKWPSQIITNSLFQFDCLILVTAFTFGYCNINQSGKRLIRFILKRYLKLVILMVFVICVTFSIPHLILPGPLTKDFLPKLSQNLHCRNNIWKNFLFLQNYQHPDCLPHTWIFCVEFQLMLMLAPLLFIQNNHRGFNWIFWLALPFLALVGFFYNFSVVYQKRLPPTYYWTLPDKEQRNEYFTEYYHKPMAHLSVFVIGFYAGIYRKLTNKCENSLIFDRNFICFGYILSFGTIFSFTFCFHDWIINELPNRFVSALYNSLQNIALSLSYSWIIFYTIGHSSNILSFLNQLCNTRLMMLLGKLTIGGYLILPIVQTILLASQQQPLYSSSILMLYVIIGNIILTYTIAIGLCLLMEIPIKLILSTLFSYLFNCKLIKDFFDEQNAKTNPLSSSSTSSSSSRNMNSIELSLNK